jgi:hypothetical protein
VAVFAKLDFHPEAPMRSAESTHSPFLKTASGMPGAVRYAIVGMWLSVVIGQSFNVYQALVCEDGMDWHALLFTSFIISSAVIVYLQVATARVWARTAYLLLLVLSYSLMVLDDSGLTRLDVISFCLTVPIDVFVTVRLFAARSTAWFSR